MLFMHLHEHLLVHMSLNLHDEINRNAVSLRDEQVVTSLLCFL